MRPTGRRPYVRPTIDRMETSDDDHRDRAGAARCGHAAAVRRAGPGVRPGQRVLHRGLRGAARAGYFLASVPKELGGGGLDLAEINAPAAADRLRRAGHRRRREHAPLLRRAVRRPPPRRRPVRRLGAAQGRRGPHLRRRPRRVGQRHPACCSRRRRAQRVDGGWEFTGPQDLRQPVAGLDVPRHPRHGHQRSRQPQGRPRLPPPRRARATGSRRRGTRMGMRATTSNDTILDRAFVPDEAIDHGLPGRASPAPGCTTSPCSPGRCSGSPACTRRSPGGRSTTRWPRCTSGRRSR